HGLPHIRFHELRHSCASLLIAQGFSLKDVQEWLGHADITLTANTYSHLDIARKKTIAEAIAGSF
ncbi:MAG: tyrosine-type recombinase/integrase, partial [Firmicutes bacterium]|nr:tyrosine-type recombinase/integrase [Bacillota bacterium]